MSKSTKRILAVAPYAPMSLKIQKTPQYEAWFRNLRDIQAQAKIVQRLFRVELGHLGDVEPVGEGVSEMRLHYGPGYRIYFMKVESVVILLLCGGDKASQRRDIKTAKEMAKAIREDTK